MKWFRLYTETLNDPKVQKLSPVLFKTWINFLCLAGQNKGDLPSEGDMCFALRLSEGELATRLQALIKAELIDAGTPLRPHNWALRQWQSDDSKERVQRHRKRHRNADVTVTVTPPDTDTDTDTERKTLGANAPEFDAFFKAYPRRGSHPNPRKPALLKFTAAVKRGIDPLKIIEAAKAFAKAERIAGRDPQFIPQAVTWLSQERWADAVEKAQAPAQGYAGAAMV